MAVKTTTFISAIKLSPVVLWLGPQSHVFQLRCVTLNKQLNNNMYWSVKITDPSVVCHLGEEVVWSPLWLNSLHRGRPRQRRTRKKVKADFFFFDALFEDAFGDRGLDGRIKVHLKARGQSRAKQRPSVVPIRQNRDQRSPAGADLYNLRCIQRKTSAKEEKIRTDEPTGCNSLDTWQQ